MSPRRLGGFLAALLLTSVLASLPATSWAGTECDYQVEAGQAEAGCQQAASETNDYIADHADHTYTIQPACLLGGVASCTETATCRANGQQGILYDVYEDGDLLPWRTCLSDGEAEHLGALTPATVARAFHKLTWPTSPLIIQPPKGRTLVNFDTNFYTTNTHPTRQTITLLGHQVTIEATPTDYTWHFAPPDTDPEPDLTTSDPGAPYPDLAVTHRYLTAGTAHPHLATTYTGRYHLDQTGWHDIPDTLTTTGPPQTLHILTATPHLVG